MSTASLSQPGVLAPVPAYGISLTFRLDPGSDAAAALKRLRDGFDPAWGVVGIGEPLTLALDRGVPGLRSFAPRSGPGIGVPATQQALWLLLGGPERSLVFDAMEKTRALLAGAFVLDDAQDTFLYAGGRDLTGYEDGTENPKDDAAEAAALAASGAGLAGGSFAAVQRWAHDLDRFNGHSPSQRNAMIGRDRESNEELDDAPASAHVRRAAQEDYDPPAFMVRRSMPWTRGAARGLEFIAYGHSLQAFEQVLDRMLGREDGVVDALFDFSRPVTGGYYWCPPLADGLLDLSALGL